MKIAVTHDKGNVFPHFGHTEQFKVYEIQNGKIQSAEVIGTNGTGHEALADFLAEKGVETLICGGIGGGAQAALAGAGIEVVSGAQGSADEAVEMYLAGELKSAGVNCDHRHGHEGAEEAPEEGASCGSSCGGGGCGGCGGGCGAPQILYEGPNAGKKVKVHYKGTFNDDTEFDSSYKRGEPMEFICGVGMMIPGFDKAVVEMKPGEKKKIHLMPEEAYGQPNPNAIATLEIAQVPGSEELSVGQRVYLQDPYGRPLPVTVTAKDDKMITFDANHEMAGKELNFEIELIEAE